MTYDIASLSDDELASLISAALAERRRRRLAQRQPRSQAQKEGRMGTQVAKGSDNLVPGVTLLLRSVGNADVWTVRASAQVPTGKTLNGKPEKRQQYLSRGVAEHGLRRAIEEVCRWRFEHARSGFVSWQAMADAAYAEALADKERVKALREAGIRV